MGSSVANANRETVLRGVLEKSSGRAGVSLFAANGHSVMVVVVVGIRWQVEFQDNIRPADL